MTAAPEFSNPYLKRAADGTISITWGARGTKACTVVADELIDEWVVEKNRIVALEADVVRLTAERDALKAQVLFLNPPKGEEVPLFEAWCDEIERRPRGDESPQFRYYHAGPAHYAINGVEVTKDEYRAALLGSVQEPQP